MCDSIVFSWCCDYALLWELIMINLECTNNMRYKNGYDKGYNKGRSDAFKVVIFFTLYSCSIVGIVKVLLLL
jgi:hypothetical protein